METVVLKPLLHRGAAHIALHYKNNAAIKSLVRRIKAVGWSRTHAGWYLPVSKENIATIKSTLGGPCTF